MPLEPTEIDLQRTLFRFLTKSARKGELADSDAAAKRLPASADGADLSASADGMQARLSVIYPDAPDLRGLLGGATQADLRRMQAYDWVTVGIYAFGLPPTKTRSGTAESSAHRALKEWAAANGETLGAPANSNGVTERWFPSGDESDVVFVGPSGSLIVEVRPRGAEAHELQQATFALVKFRAVLQAEQSLSDRRSAIRVMLVIEDEPSATTKALVEALDVELFVR